MDSKELEAKLSAPFSAMDIHWRVGATNREKTKGIALAYLDARDVMIRLDSVCGVNGWQNRYPLANNELLICEIGIYCQIAENKYEWIWKSNGAGQTQVEAEKGSASDAFKRAGVIWGIGRYLYDLPNAWVEIVPYGKSYAFSDKAKGDLTQRLKVWQDKRFGVKQ